MEDRTYLHSYSLNSKLIRVNECFNDKNITNVWVIIPVILRRGRIMRQF